MAFDLRMPTRSRASAPEQRPGGFKRKRLGASNASASLISLFSVSALVALIGGSPAAYGADLTKIAPDLARSLSGNRPAVPAAAAVIEKALRPDGDASVPVPADAPRFRVVLQTRSTPAVAMRRRLARQVTRLGRTFAGLNTVVVEATPAQILALSDDPNVVALSPDRAVLSAGQFDVNRETTGIQPTNGSPGTVYTPSAGYRIGVAVVDSGVAPVSDLAGRIVAFRDFVGDKGEPYDDFGHGTHVAGLVAGTGAASRDGILTYTGLAPQSGIIGVKVLRANGTGTIASVIAGLDWCISNSDAYNIRVINLSLGGGVFESYRRDPLCQAVERAVAAGIVVVTSAGNYGGAYGGVGSPANDPLVITVGALNTRGTLGRTDDVITSFSSRGPSRFDLSVKPDLLAPGNKIVSLRAPGSAIDEQFPDTRVPFGEYMGDANGSGETAYTRLSGTSMAAPLVAGTVARLLEINPNLTPNGVKAALMFSAQQLTGHDPVLCRRVTYDPFTQGAGALNGPGAIEMAYIMNPLGLVATPSGTTTIGDTRFSWAGVTLPALLERANGDWTQSPFHHGSAWGGPNLWSLASRWNEGLVWGGNVVWGGTTADPPIDRAFLVPNDPDLMWSQQQLWGGESSVITDANLFLNGKTSGMPVAGDVVWGGNVVWGGTTVDPPIRLVAGDDYATPF